MAERSTAQVLARNVDEILSVATTSDAKFLAQISHELRTPLNGIIGVIDLMSREEDQSLESCDTYLRSLQQSCRTLLSVVNRLQDLSHLQTFPNYEANVIFDVRAVVTGISQAMQFHDKDSEDKTQLTISFDDRIPSTVKADLTKIQQTLVNLCTIAALVSKDHSVVIKVTLKYIDRSQCTCAFHIETAGMLDVFDVFEDKLLTIESINLF